MKHHPRRRLTALVSTLALVAGLLAVLASPAGAVPPEEKPVDVSPCGTINGASLPPLATNVVLPGNATVSAFNLPSNAEVDAASSPYDCTATAGTTTSLVAATLCGNANSSGVPYTPAEAAALAADICDGEGGPSLQTPFVVGGILPNTDVPIRSGTGETGNPGIGITLSQCVPVPIADVIGGTAIPCNIALADVDLGPPIAAAQIFVGTLGFIPKPAPTLTIDSVTGQLPGAAAAREGNDLNVSGVNWDTPGGLADLTVELCDAATQLVCDAASSAALTLTSDGAGLFDLGGSVEVPAGATTGTRVLKITQASDGQSPSAAIEILGARAIVLSSSSGGLGAVITITGSGFDALQPVTVLASDGTPTPLSFGAGSVNASGQVSGSITITDANTVAIVVAENDNPTVEFASAPFTFSADLVTCDADPLTTDCVLTQEITQEVVGVALVFEQVSGNVSMSTVTLDGSPQVSSGSLEDLTITNSRGDDAAWNVQGVLLGDFVEGVPASDCLVEINHCIPADNLGWAPSASVAHLQILGDVAAVTPGASLFTADPSDPLTIDDAGHPWISGEGLGTSRTLCSTATYESGGTFACDADLHLGVPASATAGVYTAKLQLTLS